MRANHYDEGNQTDNISNSFLGNETWQLSVEFRMDLPTAIAKKNIRIKVNEVGDLDARDRTRLLLSWDVRCLPENIRQHVRKMIQELI